MITKEYLAQYTYIEQAIESTKKEIERLEKRPPVKLYDKTYGSIDVFPYTIRSFRIEGFNGSKSDVWHKELDRLQKKLSHQVQKMMDLKIEINDFICDIQDLSTRLIFKYLYIDGMKQEDVARKLHMEQSTISKRVTKYLEEVNSVTN